MPNLLSRLGALFVTAIAAAETPAGTLSVSAVQSGSWSNPATWSGAQVPVNGMPGAGNVWHVLIEENISVANDLTTTIDRLTLRGDGGGTPILGNATRDIGIADQFLWQRGAVGPAGFGRLRILDGATGTLATSSTKILRQDLAVEGMLQLDEGALAGTSAGRILNLAGGEIEYAPGFSMTLTGLVRNEAGSQFHALPGAMAAANDIAWMFDSEAGSMVRIDHPTRFNGGGVHSGNWTVAADTMLEFGGTETHVFRPESLLAPVLHLRKAGSGALNVPATSALQQIGVLEVTGGNLRFDRDVVITSGEISNSRVDAQAQAEFESLELAMVNTQLEGNGRFFFPTSSMLDVSGSNIVNATIDIAGAATVANGSSIFMGTNGAINLQSGASLELNGQVVVDSTGPLPPEPPWTFEAIEQDSIMFNNFSDVAVLVKATAFAGPRRSAGPTARARIVLTSSQVRFAEIIGGPFAFEIDSASTLRLGITTAVSASSQLSGDGVVRQHASGAPLIWPGAIDPRGDAGGTAALQVDSGLELASSSQLLLHLGSSSDRIDVAGDLRLDGELVVESAGGFDAGSYLLVDYDGTLVDAGLALAAAPAGFDYQVVIDTGASQVRLEVSPSDALLADGFESLSRLPLP